MHTPSLEASQEFVFLKANPELDSQLKKAIKTFIDNKSNKFDLEISEKSFPKLILEGILKKRKDWNFYSVDWENHLPCACSLLFAEDLIKEKFPPSLSESLIFVDQFLCEIRKPNDRKIWYLPNFARNIRQYALLQFKHNVQQDFSALQVELEKLIEAEKLWMVREIIRVIPGYQLSTLNVVLIAQKLHAIDRLSDVVNEMLRDYANLSRSNAEVLTVHLENTPELQDLVGTAIVALSKFNFDASFTKASALLKSSETELRGLKVISRLQPSNSEEYGMMYDIIIQYETEQVLCLKELAYSYYALMKHQYMSPDTKYQILPQFKNLVLHPDESVSSQAVYWLSAIKGLEVDKVDILYSLLDNGREVDYHHYFHEFKEFPLIVKFIANYFVRLRGKANVRLFTTTLKRFYRLNENTFYSGLRYLLSHNLGLVRNAGIAILISKNYGVYTVNLNALSEVRQLIALDALLSAPISIEKVLPSALTLRYSSYINIRQALSQQLKELVFAFQSTLIEVLNEYLDKEKDVDRMIINNATEGWEEQKKIIERKIETNELKPSVNQRFLLDLYSRIDAQQNSEKVAKSHNNSDMVRLGIASRISVLRGSGFKMDGSDLPITRLSKIEVRMPIDRRYFINPGKYELLYQNQINKNYNFEEE